MHVKFVGKNKSFKEREKDGILFGEKRFETSNTEEEERQCSKVKQLPKELWQKYHQ